MNLNSVLRAYARLAPVYDATFGPSLDHGRRVAVSIVNQRPGRVLEVGVGTGISLTSYLPVNEVTGIDVSTEMLGKALAKAQALRLPYIKELRAMDAASLDFPDRSFDTVVGMYLMTVVPDPVKVFKEMERVCVPGGRIIIVNHFPSRNGIKGEVAKRLKPVCNFLGWRTDFCLDDLMNCTSWRLVANHDVGWFRLFKVLQFTSTNGSGA
jgi:phosphatidylethanolamine/phosphatidyl-N-methylethanolamine N-methyltransferase